MKRPTEITTLSLDAGGALLIPDWGHLARKRALTDFKLKLAGMEDRHHLKFETCEDWKLTLSVMDHC